MRSDMFRALRAAVLTVLLLFVALQAQADITFTFTESGGTVIMTPSGTLDTSNLQVSALTDGWGGTGTEHNSTPGDIDIMGGTDVGGGITALFVFSEGTDASAITNPGGPFAFDSFPGVTIAGSKAFTTYGGFDDALRVAGIGMTETDIEGGFWTPDQSWTYPEGSTFESEGLIPGVYAVSDAVTGETITIVVDGSLVPVPTTGAWSLALLVVGLLMLGGHGLRRRYPV